MPGTAPQRTEYDLVVVGAGAIGLTAAWRAAQAGLSVLVLERDVAGAGASGVAAGMLAPVTEADFGEQELLALNLEGRAAVGRVRRRAREPPGHAVGLRRLGLPGGGRRPRRRRRAAPPARLPAALGLDSEWLASARGPRAGAGALAAHRRRDPRSPATATWTRGRWWPHWRAALAAAGGELVEGTEVAGLTRRRRAGRRAYARDTATTSRPRRAGGVRAPGAASRHCDRACRARGAAGEGPAAGAARARGPAAAGDLGWCARRAATWSARADGRVVIGATTEEQGFDTAVTAEGVFRLLEAAMEVLPEVAELELMGARAGLRPGTPDGAPGDRRRRPRRAAVGHRPRAQRSAAGSAHRHARARPARRTGGIALMPRVIRQRRTSATLPEGATVADAVREAGGPRGRSRRGGGAGRRGGLARPVAPSASSARASRSRCCTRFREDERHGGDDHRSPGSDRRWPRDRGPAVRLAPDHRHRRLSQPGDDRPGGFRVGRRDGDGGDAPGRCLDPRLVARRARGATAASCCPTPPAASPPGTR